MSKTVTIVNALHLKRSRLQKVAGDSKKNCEIVTFLRFSLVTPFLLPCRLTEISISCRNMSVIKQLFPFSRYLHCM